MTMKLKRIVLLIAVCLQALSLAAAPRIVRPGVKSPTTFAIFIDSRSYEAAAAEVDAYRAAVERDGLGTYLLIDEWQNPESVRSEIIRMTEAQPHLEGVVFVGDIPIAMIRDGQHLTSAFKSSQDRDWKDSSVPSVLFANPALSAVQDHEIAIFKEVAQKYDFDGLLLDRGRYDNIQSDFSDFSRREFEAYIGKKLDRFPEDVYAWEEDGDGGWRRIDGPYFKQWIEWRASVIYNFFKRTKEELKAVKPGLKFGAYTGAWYPSYFEVGVNWASNTYDPSQDFAWATPEYKNYGYAELLDIFTNGNYYWNVTVDEYRRSNGLHKNETDSEMSKGDHLSVEGGCRYSRRLLGGRPFFGGMYVEDYKRDTTRFKRAVEMNLRESDGLMVFDIVHIINRDWWGPLQRAVSAYEAEAKQ